MTGEEVKKQITETLSSIPTGQFHSVVGEFVRDRIMVALNMLEDIDNTIIMMYPEHKPHIPTISYYLTLMIGIEKGNEIQKVERDEAMDRANEVISDRNEKLLTFLQKKGYGKKGV